MVYIIEMSVDSDRDSVIESEDGKEAVVRITFSVTVFKKCILCSFASCT